MAEAAGAERMRFAEREGSCWSGEFPILRLSVPDARRATRRLLPHLGFTGDQEAATVIVSELMTNAVLHARRSGPSLTLRLAVREDGALVIDVADNDGDSEPRPCGLPEAASEGGRGLFLIEALGATVTWESTDGSHKHVRALLQGGAPSHGRRGRPDRLR
ncbi:ATP-binding protein [Streptomyces tsukubensis]|uniref:Histidine kinase/HSP90-like ATPase domain-containing protein n=1 Tax=Streptomyces tsukubensis TaxID=83656 RepID=A0A1V4A4P3_9ACTN|nr:ATP-binding protein [Streptomyces tsukubensis]OON74868.1 hypothetical protein B1H18_23835 [Streptomyces tsukubensis]QFR94818.1 histidine kinase [Streptomyces tsukubensis]